MGRYACCFLQKQTFLFVIHVVDPLKHLYSPTRNVKKNAYASFLIGKVCPSSNFPLRTPEVYIEQDNSIDHLKEDENKGATKS